MTGIKANDGDGTEDKVQLWAELATVKTELLKRIQLMAQLSDTDSLIKANDWLRSCVATEKRHSGLLNEAREVVRRGRELATPTAPPGGSLRESESQEPNEPFEPDQASDPIGEVTGGKARGRECRSAFVTREAERGSPLRRVSGQLFRDSSGMLVGIAYGAEREKRKNTWFLGLPADKFQAAVLLCESISGKILVFRLPQKFVERHGRHLSVSKQFKQAKFRLDKRDGRFELSTDVGAVEVGQFLDSEPLDCQRTEYV
jgi:hypothetical protein